MRKIQATAWRWVAALALVIGCINIATGQPAAFLTQGVGLYWWNGTAWASWSTSNPAPVTFVAGGTPQDVNLAQVAGATVATGHGTGAGAQRVELPTDGTGKVGLNAGTALIGNVGIVYPAGSTPVTNSAAGTTGATTATLAASASISTYVCGFSIRANATAAATADSTVTGVTGGTLHFTQWTAPNASGIGLTEMIFSPCLKSSAINTGIAVISAAPGAGGVVSVTAWGFQL